MPSSTTYSSSESKEPKYFTMQYSDSSDFPPCCCKVGILFYFDPSCRQPFKGCTIILQVCLINLKQGIQANIWIIQKKAWESYSQPLRVPWTIHYAFKILSLLQKKMYCMATYEQSDSCIRADYSFVHSFILHFLPIPKTKLSAALLWATLAVVRSLIFIAGLYFIHGTDD